MRRVRNIGFFGQGKSGKTTLAEALLLKAGAISRLGSVTDGNTTLDYDPEETKRQFSINLGLAFLDWKGVRVNLVDAPGYADFSGEAVSAAAAVDFGVIVIPADSGPGVGAENAWKLLKAQERPTIVFVNKNDVAPADTAALAERLTEKWQSRVIPWADRDTMVEAVAEADDKLIEKFLEEGALGDEEFAAGFRKALLDRSVVPLFTGAALKDEGLAEFLDFLVENLPEYQDLPPLKLDGEAGTAARRAGEPLLVQVFKTASDPYVGRLSYFKVLAGTLAPNSGLVNAGRSEKERFGQFFFVQGKKQEPVERGEPGDILSVAKLNHTRTGDTLTVAGQEARRLPGLAFPAPSISISIAPKEKGSEDKLGSAISRIMEEDPTICINRDAQTGETILSGLGDLQLDIWVNRLAGRFGVAVVKGVPRIAYQETVTAEASGQGRFKRQTGGHGQYGDCWLKVEPLPRGEGFEFVNAIVGGVIPRQYIPSVEKGVREAMSKGVLAGYPVADVKVTLYDGSYHPVDSSDIAFQIAGSLALKKVAQAAKPALLEPVMNVEVVAPKDNVGDVIADVNGRRGRVLNMDAADSENQVVSCQVPLAEMASYATSLRSLSSGRASYQAQLSHYDFVPFQNAEKIINEREEEKDRE